MTFKIVENSDDVIELGEKIGDTSITVTAKRVEGTAKVVATCLGADNATITSNEITITVSDKIAHVTGLSFTGLGNTALVGDTIPMNNYLEIAAETPKEGQVQNKDIEWSVDNSAAASIDKNGLFTALGAVDSVVVTARSKQDNVEASASLRIKRVSATQLTITNQDGYDEIDVKETVHLVATVTPYNVEDQTIEWSVISGETVASVNQSGLVTGLSDGTAVIKAQIKNKANPDDDEVSNTYTITVNDADLKIVSMNKPTSILSYESRVHNADPVDSTLHSNSNLGNDNFFEHEDADKALYTVGLNGLFEFKPTVKTRDADGQDKPYNLTEFNRVLKLRNSQGEFEEVDLNTYMNVDSTEHYKYEMLPAAEGKVFELTVMPASSDDYIVPRSLKSQIKSTIRFKVVDGYNAYTMADLDNFSDLNVKGLVLHNDIDIISEVLNPNDLFTEARVNEYLSTEAGRTDFTQWATAIGFKQQKGDGYIVDETAAIEALKDSPLDYTYLFARDTMVDSEVFNFEGNYFNLNASQLKPVCFINASPSDFDANNVYTGASDADEEKHRTLLKGFNGDGSHSAVFAVNKDDNSARWSYLRSHLGGETPTLENRDIFNLRNVHVISNGSKYGATALETGRYKGSFTGFKFQSIDARIENAIVNHAFTGFEMDDWDSWYYTTSSLDRVKCYDTYNVMFYYYGGTVDNTITNSWLAGSGGPLVFMDETAINPTRGDNITSNELFTELDQDLGDNKLYYIFAPEINAENVYMSNPVYGTEQWFAGHSPANTLVQGKLIAPGNKSYHGWIAELAETAYADSSITDKTRVRNVSGIDDNAPFMDMLVLDIAVGPFFANKVAKTRGVFNLTNGDEIIGYDMKQDLGYNRNDLNGSFTTNSSALLDSAGRYTIKGSKFDDNDSYPLASCNDTVINPVDYEFNVTGRNPLIDSNYLVYFYMPAFDNNIFHRMTVLAKTYSYAQYWVTPSA